LDATNDRERDRAAAAYVECAEWTDESDWQDEWTLTLAGERELSADLYAFLDDADVARDVADLSPESVGHDFWLTRNGHGAGFWDRGLGELGERLSAAARVYGEDYVSNYVTVYPIREEG
jgi:hypothetical protein